MMIPEEEDSATIALVKAIREVDSPYEKGMLSRLIARMPMDTSFDFQALSDAWKELLGRMGCMNGSNGSELFGVIAEKKTRAEREFERRRRLELENIYS